MFFQLLEEINYFKGEKMVFSLETWEPVAVAVILTSTLTTLGAEDILFKAAIPAVVGGTLAAGIERQKVTPIKEPVREFVVISALTGVIAHFLGSDFSTNRPEMAHITGFALASAVYLVGMAAIETYRRGPLPSYRL